MNWDTVDVAIADLGVWVAVYGIPVAILGGVLLACSVGAWLASRQHDEPEEREEQDYRPTRDDMASLIWRADWERARADAAEARLRNVTAGLQRVFDQDTLIRLDAETDWEIRP